MDWSYKGPVSVVDQGQKVLTCNKETKMKAKWKEHWEQKQNREEKQTICQGRNGGTRKCNANEEQGGQIRQPRRW